MTADERDGAFESPDAAREAELADSLDIEDAAEPPLPREPRNGPTAAAAPHPPEGGGPAAGPSAAPEPAGGPAAPASRHRRGKRSARKRRRKAPWWELPLLVMFAVLVAVLVKTFLVQPFYIPSQSMEKTLHGCPGCSGDRILVNKVIYDVRDPHPGDVVVFNAPPGWNEEPPSVPPSNPVLRAIRGFGQLIGFVPPDGLVLVKRVIATGGQTVKGIAGKDGQPDRVLVSDTGPGGPWRTLNEPYVYEDGPDGRADFGPVTVPQGRLWVMGDHRNDSADSRFHCDTSGSGGSSGASCDPVTSTVPDGDVIGKAFVIVWPPSRWRTLGTPSTFQHAALGMAVPAAAPVAAFAAAALVLPRCRARRRSRRRARPDGG